MGHTEILSIPSTYHAMVDNTTSTALFDSGATLSCISKCFYDNIQWLELDWVIEMNAGPPIIITSASDDELINLGWYRLHFKLGQKTFEYYFQIIKNLKQNLILGLNFQRTYKILQDVTDDDNLYLHIKNNTITFNIQAKNAKNYIQIWECMHINRKSWKQFDIKAPKGLNGGQVYEIDCNARGLPKDVIPIRYTWSTSQKIWWGSKKASTLAQSKAEYSLMKKPAKSSTRWRCRTKLSARWTLDYWTTWSPGMTRYKWRDQYSTWMTPNYHLKWRKNWIASSKNIQTYLVRM